MPAPAQNLEPLAHPAPEAPRAVEQQVLSVNGQPARVFVGGEGDRAILLLHGGWGGAALHWSRVWDRLAQRTRVVAPDLPGIGNTAVPGRARLSEYVDWLEQVLDGLGVKKALCVGNSFGASLAWSFAGRSPERCLGVVLVDGVPMPRTPAPMLWLGHRPLGRGLMRVLLRQKSFTPAALPRAFADPSRAPRELRSGLVETPPVRLESFLDCLIDGDGPPAPKAPVLVLWGEGDRLPGTHLAAGKRLAASLPGARFVSIPSAGHFPQLERPDAFTDAVLDFADAISGQWSEKLLAPTAAPLA